MVQLLAWLLLLTLGVPGLSGETNHIRGLKQYSLPRRSTRTGQVPVSGVSGSARTGQVPVRGALGNALMGQVPVRRAPGNAFQRPRLPSRQEWPSPAAERPRNGQISLPWERQSKSAQPTCQNKAPWDCAFQCQKHIADIKLPCNDTSSPRAPAGLAFEAAMYERPSGVHNRVLCFSAVPFEDTTVKNVISNIMETEDYCDWALISYSRQAVAWSRYMAENPVHGHPPLADRVRILTDLRPVDMITPSTCSMPYGSQNKLQGWRQLVEDYGQILDQYVMIHLLDDDMVLPGFDTEDFMRHVVCGVPMGPPMISQPTMAVEGKLFTFVLDSYWAQQPDVPHIVESLYVEIQAPLLMMSFFKWVMRTVYLPQVHVMWDVDWGLDHVWCHAARHYMVKELKVAEAKIDAGSALACAMYPKSPMTTRNFNHLGDIKCNGFVSRGFAVEATYEAVYPYWFVSVLKQHHEVVLQRHFKGQRGMYTCDWRAELDKLPSRG